MNDSESLRQVLDIKKIDPSKIDFGKAIEDVEKQVQALEKAKRVTRETLNLEFTI